MNSQFFNKLQSQPVFRIQVISFLLVSLLPLVFLSINIYRLAWDDEWREIREKHQLLAENLASPIYNYVTQFRDSLAILAESTRGKDIHNPDLLELTNLFQTGFRGLQAISLIDNKGKTIFIIDEAGKHISGDIDTDHGIERCYIKTMKSKKFVISGISPSPTNSKPVIIITQPIFGQSDTLIGVLMGELKIDEIERLRKNIHFGEKGHSAIVDSNGHVIAHPNPDWMKEMRDISHLSVIKEMMAGKTGVTEFYSPFVKQNMVAGYTSVPELRWGVMVPQPKSEVEDQVNDIMSSHLYWILSGFVLAIAIALILVRWITRPINLLSNSAKNLAENSFEGELVEISENAPREIKQLGDSFKDLVNGFQKSKNEINDLNQTLMLKVDAATSGLRVANNELKKIAGSDHLTSLANRRYFEQVLASNVAKNHTEELCVLLIDLDNFKDINDKYGHAAGDSVLVQVSELLSKSMRDDDLIARYGGDEIAAQLNCTVTVAKERAEDIRKTVEAHEFTWGEGILHLTVSIGLLECEAEESANINELLKKVDSALYDAKKAGRNVVKEY